MSTQWIALLFSGGDAPGMNQLLRAWVRLGANRHAACMLGIADGFRGLVRFAATTPERAEALATLPLLRPGGELSHPAYRLDRDSVCGLASRGGIVLGTSRCPEFRAASTRQAALRRLSSLGIKALVLCGGEGSLTAASLMEQESELQIIGIPATIDNDLPGTDLALGFDTAVNTAATAVRRFNDTAGSHHRIMVLEVMGRACGQLAVHAALASGAELVVTPERGILDEPKLRNIAVRLQKSFRHGRRHAIVIVAEGVRVAGATPGVGPAAMLGAALESYFAADASAPCEIETRVSVLGHLQRGGAPTASDQILAARFAEGAWQALANPTSPSGIVCLRGGQISLVPFGESATGAASPSADLYLLQKDITRVVPQPQASP